MGYIRHHSIIVTSFSERDIKEAKEFADNIGCNTTNIVDSGMNGYATFCVVPDGSKEGWPDSDEGDEQRKEFKEWLHKQAYDDGSSSLDWVEVQYGDDNLETEVIEDSEKLLRQKYD